MFGIPSLCQTVRVGMSALVTLKKELKHGYFCDPDSNRRAFRMLGPYCLPDFYTSYLKWIKDIYQCDLLLCEDKSKVKIAHF